MLLRSHLVALLAAAALLSPALAQDNDLAKAVRAVPLQPGEIIKLDGSLSHPAWQRAPVWQDFVEHQPVNGGPPPQRTQVQVLFDEHALYVGVTVLDSDPSRIRDLPVRNDQVNRTQDFIVVYVDPIGTRQSAQFFRLNAAGSMADGLHTAADDSEDFSPDFDWDAAVRRNPQGWTAVLRLPFASLRYAEAAPGVPQRPWRFMVGRRIPREQFHLATSVLIPRDVPSFIHTLQPLLGVALPANHQFLTLRPSVTLRRTQDRETGGPSKSKTDVDASLDIKWRPRAELVVDATLNPDFSQVALDVPQLAGNSLFALSFPEKRPFFFESADLLRSPSEAFYTRSFTLPRWGLRATWRGQNLSGTALAVNDRGGGQVFLPGPYSTAFADQPASTTLTARGLWHAGALQWGVVAASRRYADDRGDNQVAGPDLGWQINDQWRLRAQWLGSSTSALANAAGTLARGPSRDGQRAIVRLLRQAGDGESELAIDQISRDFRHDTGFVNQAGVRVLTAFQSWGWRPLGPFNEFFLNIRAEQQREQGSGQLVRQDIRPGLWSSAARNLEWWVELHPASQVRATRNGPLLDEHFVATGLVMTPATWFPLVDAKLSAGRLADTGAQKVRDGFRIDLLAKLRPLRPLEVELNGSRLELGDQVTDTTGQLLAVWHFDARQTLRAIVQRTRFSRRAEPGVRAEQYASEASTLTYTWRRSTGTALYVGASRSADGRPATRRTTEAFVKLQFDVDDARGLW